MEKPKIAKVALPVRVRKPRVKKVKPSIPEVKPELKPVKELKKRGQPELLKKIQAEAKQYRILHPDAKWKDCIREGSKLLKKEVQIL